MSLTTRVHVQGISWVIAMKHLHDRKINKIKTDCKAIQHLKDKQKRQKGSGAGRGGVKQETSITEDRKATGSKEKRVIV